MSHQFSRRAFLTLTGGATTTTITGCSNLTGSTETTALPLGEPATLTDTDTVTVHDLWIQQTFVYRNGPHKSIGGNANSQFICLYVSGGVENGSFSLQVDDAEYTPPERPAGYIHKSRILNEHLTKTPPEQPDDIELVVFEVPLEVKTDFVEIVYESSAGTGRWQASDAIRARLHFPPQLSVTTESLPDSIPPNEPSTLEVTLENSGGSDATIHVRDGVLETQSEFPIRPVTIESGDSVTVSTEVTPTENDETLTYMFDWGVSYFEHELVIDQDASSSDNEDSDGADTAY